MQTIAIDMVSIKFYTEILCECVKIHYWYWQILKINHFNLRHKSEKIGK